MQMVIVMVIVILIVMLIRMLIRMVMLMRMLMVTLMVMLMVTRPHLVKGMSVIVFLTTNASTATDGTKAWLGPGRYWTPILLKSQDTGHDFSLGLSCG